MNSCWARFLVLAILAVPALLATWPTQAIAQPAGAAEIATYRPRCGPWLAMAHQAPRASADLRYVAFSRNVGCEPYGLEVGDFRTGRQAGFFAITGTPCNPGIDYKEFVFTDHGLAWVCMLPRPLDDSPHTLSIYRWAAPYTDEPERQDVSLSLDPEHFASILGMASHPASGRLLISLVTRTLAGPSGAHVFSVDQSGDAQDLLPQFPTWSGEGARIPTEIFYGPRGWTIFANIVESSQVRQIAYRLDSARSDVTQLAELPYVIAAADLTLSDTDVVAISGFQGGSERFLALYDLTSGTELGRLNSEGPGPRHQGGEVSADGGLAIWFDRAECAVEGWNGSGFRHRVRAVMPGARCAAVAIPVRENLILLSSQRRIDLLRLEARPEPAAW